MASIRRPHSPAKQQHLLKHHHHPFASSPPSSPLRHSSSPRKVAAAGSYPHPFLLLFFSFSSRRPLPRFAAFFLLGSFLGLLHFLSHLPHAHHHHHIQPSSSSTTSPAISTGTTTPTTLHRAQRKEEEEDHHQSNKDLLIVVTPTHARAAQSLYLTRMGHTLRLVRPPLLWLVVEAGKPTPEAAAVLRRTSVAHRYVGTGGGERINPNLNASSSSSSPVDGYRAHQMNAALELVENHRLHGIVYFAHEEDVHSIHLFHQMRRIRRFGTWPVPVFSPNTKDGVVLEGPVCKEGQVMGWHTSEDGSKLRRFHVVMSGFAFNSTMLWDPRLRSHLAWNSIRHPDTMKEGFDGTTFVEQLVEDESQMEGIPADCSQIMNWHVPFGSENLAYPKGWRVATNLDVIIPLK